MEEFENVALQLKNERIKQKISQVEMSKKMGVTQQYVSSIEKGKVKDLLTLKKYAEAMNKHVDFKIVLID